MRNKNRIKIGLAALVSLLLPLAAVAPALASSTVYFSLSPGSGSYTVGDPVSLSISVTADASDNVGEAKANLSYPDGLLQPTSGSATLGSTFDSASQNTVGSGTITIDATASGGVTGTQTLATVTFTVLAAGNATVSFTGGSEIDSAGVAVDDGSRPSASYTLSSPAPPADSGDTSGGGSSSSSGNTTTPGSTSDTTGNTSKTSQTATPSTASKQQPTAAPTTTKATTTPAVAKPATTTPATQSKHAAARSSSWPTIALIAGAAVAAVGGGIFAFVKFSAQPVKPSGAMPAGMVVGSAGAPPEQVTPGDPDRPVPPKPQPPAQPPASPPAGPA